MEASATGFWQEVVGTAVGEPEVWAMCLVGVFVLLDCASGLAKAAKSGTLSSKVMREGLWHKAGYALIVAAAVVIEVGSGHLDMGFTVPLVVPACVYIVVNELMSVIENVAELNPSLKGSKLLGLFGVGKDGDAKGEKGEKDGL